MRDAVKKSLSAEESPPDRFPFPFVSIIVPAKNQEHSIRSCLSAISNLDYPADRVEVIVVDGRSGDNTARIAEESGAIVVFDDGRGRCRAHGLNAGIPRASGQYIAFTDPDCRVDVGWLKSALRHFHSFDVGAVGGLLSAAPDSPLISRVATFIEYLLPNPSVPREVAPVPFLVGGNSIFRSEALRSVLPIPEPLAGEDAVISLRLRDSGWRLFFDPSLVVWHEMHYSTFGDLSRHKYLMGRGAQQCWRTDRRLIHWQSPVKAYMLPALVISAVITLLVNRFLFVLLAGVGLLILSFLSALCWRKTGSIRGAILFPVALAVMSSGHSAGFLREAALSLIHGEGEPAAT